MAKAVKAVLSKQRSALRSLTLPKNATSAMKAAVLPSIVKAVGKGAQRVADVAGTGTVSPTTTIAGAWAFKFAQQTTDTTQGQLDDLTEDTDDAVDQLFDTRADLALAMVATILSNAINSGAQNYAVSLPETAQPQKTWEVTDDHPCTDCSSVDGETVPAATDFSNGAPFPAIHSGCMCTTSWTQATAA